MLTESECTAFGYTDRSRRPPCCAAVVTNIVVLRRLCPAAPVVDGRVAWSSTGARNERNGDVRPSVWTRLRARVAGSYGARNRHVVRRPRGHRHCCPAVSLPGCAGRHFDSCLAQYKRRACWGRRPAQTVVRRTPFTRSSTGVWLGRRPERRRSAVETCGLRMDPTTGPCGWVVRRTVGVLLGGYSLSQARTESLSAPRAGGAVCSRVHSVSPSNSRIGGPGSSILPSTG